MVELILGGVRSGKSREAQNRAASSGMEVIYIATATAGDDEMDQRIARHRAERPADWGTIEEPFALGDAIQQAAADTRCLVVDCLTLWLSNWLALKGDDTQGFAAARSRLLQSLVSSPGRVILVSNETNQGIVPLTPLSRHFCDEAGWLHQEIARHCEHVTLMVAGLPLELKRGKS